MNKSALETVSLWLAGNVETTPPFEELASRQDVFVMTRQAQEAVLGPADAGAWPHAYRAALAARIADANNNPYLAGLYRKDAAGSPFEALISADYLSQDVLEQKVIRFMDKVANHTKDIAPEDIAELQQAGVADADIVRLCELNAFLAYQIRVAAGLASLIEGEQA